MLYCTYSASIKSHRWGAQLALLYFFIFRPQQLTAEPLSHPSSRSPSPSLTNILAVVFLVGRRAVADGGHGPEPDDLRERFGRRHLRLDRRLPLHHRHAQGRRDVGSLAILLQFQKTLR